MNKQTLHTVLTKHNITIDPSADDDAIRSQLESGLAALVANEAAAKANFQAERDARITGLVTEAIGTGKLPANAKDVWLGKLRADFANAALELAHIKPAMKFTGITDGMGARKAGFANGSADLEKFHRLVTTKMATGLSYRQAFAAARAEDPTLLPE